MAFGTFTIFPLSYSVQSVETQLLYDYLGWASATAQANFCSDTHYNHRRLSKSTKIVETKMVN